MQFNSGWVDTADEVNLMGNSMSRQGYAPTHLVLHGTAGGSDAHGVGNYMGTAGVSTHFVISTDGTIVQCVSCDVAAYANAPLWSPRLTFDHADVNPNYWTISIEFCKPDSTNVVNITDAQLQAGVELADLICTQYNIPRQRSDGHGGIIGHCDINSVERAMCPGTFPWDTFFAQLQGEDPVLQQKLTDLQVAYDKVVATKNSLVADKASLAQQLSDTQAKLATLQNAWNKVVTEKNALIADKAALVQQVTDLQKQLAAATSNINVTLIQQQNAALVNKLQQIKALIG